MMNRRYLLGLIGLAPLTLVSAKIPSYETTIIATLIKRWEKSKTYTLAVFEAMPEDHLEYRPSPYQMSFAQHFLHMGFTNNKFIGILVDSKTYPDYESVMSGATFFIERPDPINLFQPDSLQERDPLTNKALVGKYLVDTFDYVISSLATLHDDILTKGETKEKPWYLEGHTNLDLILRGESHTAHHRAQAISYLRMNAIGPPGYSKHNTL